MALSRVWPRRDEQELEFDGFYEWGISYVARSGECDSDGVWRVEAGIYRICESDAVECAAAGRYEFDNGASAGEERGGGDATDIAAGAVKCAADADSGWEPCCGGASGR